MTKQWEEITDEFDAQSENGQIYRVVVSTTMIDVRSAANRNAVPTEGRLKTYRTSDGHHCNRIDDNTYQIVELELLEIKRV